MGARRGAAGTAAILDGAAACDADVAETKTDEFVDDDGVDDLDAACR